MDAEKPKGTKIPGKGPCVEHPHHPDKPRIQDGIPASPSCDSSKGVFLSGF